MRPSYPWAALLAIGVGYETWALLHDRPDATLSVATRRAFRTDTRLGRCAFVAGAVGFVTWFVPHILGGERVTPGGAAPFSR